MVEFVVSRPRVDPRVDWGVMRQLGMSVASAEAS
jgi:hypothetical protein